MARITSHLPRPRKRVEHTADRALTHPPAAQPPRSSESELRASSDTATTSFDEHALAELPEVAGFTGDLRLRALREFEAMPIPSQETEEWRYTDLSDFDLDFAHSRRVVAPRP